MSGLQTGHLGCQENRALALGTRSLTSSHEYCRELMIRPLTFVVLLGVAGAIHGQSTPRQRHAITFGTFSNLRYIPESGDVLGIEITIVPQYKTAYAIFQCGEGAPTDPVFVPVELKRNHFRFVIRSQDRSCDGIFIGTITQRGMNLAAVSEVPNQEAYNAGGFLPRRLSYWSR